MATRIRLIGLSIALLAIVMSLYACGGGPKRQLRMNLPPGSAYELTLRAETNFNAKTAEGDRPFKNESTTRLLCRIASVYENGDMLANVTIEEIGSVLGVAQDKKAAEGARYFARISPLGEVVEVLGSNELRDAVRAKPKRKPASGDGDSESSREKFISAQLSDDQLRLPLELAFRIWPAVPVSTGDVWESGQMYDPNNDVFVTRTFTLKSWDPAIVTVAFTAKIAPAERQNGFRFSGTGSGEVRISPVEGVLKSASFTRSYSGSTAPSADPAVTLSAEGTYQIDFVAR